MNEIKEIDGEMRVSETIKMKGKFYLLSIFNIIRESVPRIIGYKYYERILNDLG